jgi:hypothetical protein
MSDWENTGAICRRCKSRIYYNEDFVDTDGKHHGPTWKCFNCDSYYGKEQGLLRLRDDKKGK